MSLEAEEAHCRERLAEDQVEHYKAERNAARVEARREFRDQIAAAHAAREGMAEVTLQFKTRADCDAWDSWKRKTFKNGEPIEPKYGKETSK